MSNSGPHEGPAILLRSVSELKLSRRARFCMICLGINTIGQLVGHTGAELLKCKNFGPYALHELRKKLWWWGLELRDNLVACEYCGIGQAPAFLDVDGVRCEISGLPGQLAHAYEDSWWPCPRYAAIVFCPSTTPVAEVSIQTTETNRNHGRQSAPEAG